MGKIIYGICLFFLPLIFCSCTLQPMAPVEWRYEKSAITLHVTADPLLNLYRGSAHALHLCIYQLMDPDPFNRLSQNSEGISELLQCRGFDSSVANARVLSRSGIQPGDSLTFMLDRTQGAKYLGIVAGYQILEQERTVRLIKIPVTVEIAIDGLLQIERIQKPAIFGIDLHLGPQYIQKTVVMKLKQKNAETERVIFQ